MLALVIGPALADLPLDQLSPPLHVIDPGQRRAVEERLRREAEAEAQREAEEAAAEARRLAEIEAFRAARPLGQKVVEDRCILCHTADRFLPVRHTRLGWELVTLRMVWWNKAPLSNEERSAAAAWLATHQAAVGIEALFEIGTGMGLLLSLVVTLWIGIRLRHRRQATFR